jgi:DNA polymerase-3 subunit gamma/tau
LRVVDPPVVSRSACAFSLAPGQPASPVLGVPVRVQSEPAQDISAGNRTASRLVLTEEGDFWHANVTAMAAAESITALVRELALQSQLVARDDGHWMLRVERESLNQPASRERLQTALHWPRLATR